MVEKNYYNKEEYKTINELIEEFGITRWTITKAILSGKIIADIDREVSTKNKQSRYLVQLSSFKKWFEAMKLLHPEQISKQE